MRPNQQNFGFGMVALPLLGIGIAVVWLWTTSPATAEGLLQGALWQNWPVLCVLLVGLLIVVISWNKIWASLISLTMSLVGLIVVLVVALALITGWNQYLLKNSNGKMTAHSQGMRIFNQIKDQVQGKLISTLPASREGQAEEAPPNTPVPQEVKGNGAWWKQAEE
jgi:hypothetical protein